jgi:hypothetical protein
LSWEAIYLKLVLLTDELKEGRVLVKHSNKPFSASKGMSFHYLKINFLLIIEQNTRKHRILVVPEVNFLQNQQTAQVTNLRLYFLEPFIFIQNHVKVSGFPLFLE